MEPSPLTQQARPSSFQPKIVRLYEDLFAVDNEEDLAGSDGFWGEFFLLRPDKVPLEKQLETLSPEDLLSLQNETQQLFKRAVHCVRLGKSPSDEHALDTLTVFLGSVLTKRYTNPSADIITVLAGLDDVDAVFYEFANAIEGTIRAGGPLEDRTKAIDVALSLTSGAYQTSLVSFFTHRDLFPALMKYINDSEVPEQVFKPFLLLGLLANYNKFEFRNPYRLRLEDFVNESAIVKIIQGLGVSCSQSRDYYVAVQEDIAEGWTLSNALAYLSLGLLAPAKVPMPALPKADEIKEGFAILPNPSAAVLLGAYDFTIANKVFCSHFLTCPVNPRTGEAPLSAFLSFTSYTLHHAYRSPRATLYGQLDLLILRVIIEDLILCKVLFNLEAPLSIRLCRQRQPLLPATAKPRPAAATILDILVDTINHNLRRNLDLPLYICTLNLVHRLLSYVTLTRTKLSYHWSLLWQTLLSFLRFLSTYTASFSSQDPDVILLIKPFLASLALAVTAGDTFLPDPAAYDDLFYKLVETGEYLARFKKAFEPHLTQLEANTSPNGSTTAPIDILLQVATHYHDLVEEEKGKGRLGVNASPREVSKVIRAGYETLRLPAMDGLDRWDRFREGEERSLLKRIARVAVDDTKRVLGVSR